MIWQSERYIFTLNMHFSAQEAAIVEEDLSPFAQKTKPRKSRRRLMKNSQKEIVGIKEEL